MFKKILIFAAVLSAAALVLYNVLLALFPVHYSEVVEKYAVQYGVEPETVYAIIKAESDFDAAAASHKGAVGLMQITPDTGEWCAGKINLAQYKTEDLSDPETNINIGIWYFAYLRDTMQSEELAVISYNAGIGKVRSWIADGIVKAEEIEADTIPYEETRKYLKKVQLFKKIYKSLYKL